MWGAGPGGLEVRERVPRCQAYPCRPDSFQRSQIRPGQSSGPVYGGGVASAELVSSDREQLPGSGSLCIESAAGAELGGCLA